MPELEAVIGLEVHAQMNTKTKLFCGCDNDAFEKAPNTTVCPICTGHPGTLPVPNASAIEKAIKTALALRCKINEDNHFDRKHYFYPDLPAGFQISQYDYPLASRGSIEYVHNGVTKTCNITRLHIENDAGKLSHRGNITLCDYNRAGTPLMEIVTEPDLRSNAEAVTFVQELRRILIAVSASEADMFKGMMRFDASISLREKGSDKLNPRSEIKNLNSFKSLEKALAYEEKRLRALWEEQKGPPKNDITVGWLDDEERTRMLRDKEKADDYRYFPEPDIPPLKIDKALVRSIQESLPLLPGDLKIQYVSLGLTESEALQLIDQPLLRTHYDAVHKKTGDAKRASGIVLTQLLGFLNAAKKEIGEGPPTAALLDLVEAITSGTISPNAAKDVLEKMVQTGRGAKEIIATEGMQQISDTAALEELVKKAVAANPKAIEAFKSGKESALGAVVGWIMKETKGQANPAKVNELLRKAIA